ncbi:NAD(P)-binding domain-containing protein [Glutamicibacter sp. MNS18]|uniref:NADPH-dependent F420 reductase n=1 Tax=Glutamicibacter sp. MNS18 TaxID=2989817 RepID=UPI0022367D85|nr:NAD(P)-binding domain-containing protein [Glutamicibacter sp. MNS18]MCW4464913.1 NAD(P)-binding domain-containing protein [Glutamicibacter sp. MNS18]
MTTSCQTSGKRVERIGILGAGRAGTALARIAAESGIPVNIAASRPPRMLKYHLMQYAPQAVAVNAEGIADGVGLVVLMVPQEDLDDIDPGTLAGITLVDATNRWQQEELPDWFEQGLRTGLSSSEVIAGHFDQARVVKALNHISHWDLDSFGRKSANPRRALGLASDYPEDALLTAGLLEALGYEPVVLDSLADGKLLEPGSAVFNQHLSASGLRQLLQL